MHLYLDMIQKSSWSCNKNIDTFSYSEKKYSTTWNYDYMGELKQTTTTTATRTLCYKSLYISLPSFAQQREITKLGVVFGTWTTTANFTYLHLELNVVVAYLA